MASSVVAAFHALVNHDAAYGAHETIAIITCTVVAAHRVQTLLLARVHRRVMGSALVDVCAVDTVAGEPRRAHTHVATESVDACREVIPWGPLPAPGVALYLAFVLFHGGSKAGFGLGGLPEVEARTA